MKEFCLVALLAFATPALAADTIPPDPPASLQAEYVPHYITLTWTASPSGDVTSYRVYRSPSCDIFPECGPTLQATLASSEDLTFTGSYGEQGFGGTLTYGVAAVDADGNESSIAWPSVVGTGGTNAEILVFASPAPNPSRGNVAFSWTMPSAGTARLTIVDLAGRTVRTLAGGSLSAGPQRVTWDGRDARGQVVRPGAYFARLDTRWGSRSRMFVRVL